MNDTLSIYPLTRTFVNIIIHISSHLFLRINVLFENNIQISGLEILNNESMRAVGKVDVEYLADN